MCGISGIVDLKAKRAIDEALLQRMNATLTHRGPDGDGFHIEPGAGLGHRRLSIIDLAGGKQPLYNEDATVVVTYNGEIYNFQELMKELVACGHTFRTRCDTEVIVHAWEEWGERCVDRFNGMFAFALWDKTAEVLFLARDRLGIKPLYYAVSASGLLIFGSELKALLLHPAIERDLDPQAIEEYFTFGYVPDPKTIYKSVHKLEPGTTLLARRNKPMQAPRRYWDVPLAGEHTGAGSAAEWCESIRDELKSSVDRRLVADVPLGAFLSGGIDSSAVVAMMRELGTESLLTCCIGFEEDRYDESKYAEIVARAKETDHHVEFVEAADYGLLDKLVSMYDEPFADSSAIPTYRVCELARKHVTVALSGDGGDENFIGYRRYRLFAAEESIRRALPYSVRRPLFGMLGRYYPKLDWAPRIFRGKTTFQALGRSSMEAYLHGVSIFPEEGRRNLFSADFLQTLGGYRSREVFARHLEGKKFENAMAMVQYLDFKTYLPGDILTKVDRASMAHSLEVRVPFLDHRFVELIAGIPSGLKLSRGRSKYILKEALRPVLPDEILFRKKMGFAVPLDVWFRGSLRDHVMDVMRGPRLAQTGIFDNDYLQQLANEHASKKRDHAAILWSLLMLDGFLQKQT